MFVEGGATDIRVVGDATNDETVEGGSDSIRAVQHLLALGGMYTECGLTTARSDNTVAHYLAVAGIGGEDSGSGKLTAGREVG